MSLALDWTAMLPGLTALTSLQMKSCDHLAVGATAQFSQLTRLQARAWLLPAGRMPGHRRPRQRSTLTGLLLQVLDLDTCMVVQDASLYAFAALTGLRTLDLTSAQVRMPHAPGWPGCWSRGPRLAPYSSLLMCHLCCAAGGR